MAKGRFELLRDVFKPRLVRIWTVLFGTLAAWDIGSNQFGLPKISELWGMSGSLLTWWGWLLILQAIFVFALFEYVRRLPSPAAGPVDADELARLTERTARIEERLDGAQVAPAVGQAGSAKAPSIKLTAAEQERMTDRLIKLDDYLAGELSEQLQPIRGLLNWEKILQLEGAAGLHAKVEAPRPGLPNMMEHTAQTLSPFQAETDVLGINPLYIKTKMIPLSDALMELSSVTEIMQADSINNGPLRLPGRNYARVVGEIYNEIERVRREIADWRKRIAQGELG